MEGPVDLDVESIAVGRAVSDALPFFERVRHSVDPIAHDIREVCFEVLDPWSRGCVLAVSRKHAYRARRRPRLDPRLAMGTGPAR